MAHKEERDVKEEALRVAVRVRPLIPREKSEGCRQAVRCIDDTQLVLGKDRAFTFDVVFGPTATQAEIYEKAVQNLVDGLFQGYNATVFAYGQTGSGKTFTMGSGVLDDMDSEQVGIIPRAVQQVFAAVAARHDRGAVTVRASYLEIYNEEIHDLLRPLPGAKHIHIREDAAGDIAIAGLHEETVSSVAQTLHCLERGALQRATGAHAMNEYSSRSHAIFTLVVEQRARPSAAGAEAEVVRAKLHLVDLAGSERNKRTGAVGTRLKEAININSGLLALGNVIAALADERRGRHHVPYRQSKLTRILQDSLGGNARTLMLACISPADASFEETHNTLKYANRAKNIHNKPIVNRDTHVAQLADLRQEIRALNERLRAAAAAAAPAGSAEHPDDGEGLAHGGAAAGPDSAGPAVPVLAPDGRAPVASAAAAAAAAVQRSPAGAVRSPLSPGSGDGSTRRAGWRQRMRAELDAAQAALRQQGDALARVVGERDQRSRMLMLLAAAARDVISTAAGTPALDDSLLASVARLQRALAELATPPGSPTAAAPPALAGPFDSPADPAAALAELQRALAVSQQQHAAAVAELAEARADLQRDEEIFARRNAELKRLQRTVRELQAEREALLQRVHALDPAAPPVLAVTAPGSAVASVEERAGGAMGTASAAGAVDQSAGDGGAGAPGVDDELQSPQRLAMQARQPVLQDESVLLGSPTGAQPHSPQLMSPGVPPAPDTALRTPLPARAVPVRQPAPVLLAPPPTAGTSAELAARDPHESVGGEAPPPHMSEEDLQALEEREHALREAYRVFRHLETALQLKAQLHAELIASLRNENSQPERAALVARHADELRAEVESMKAEYAALRKHIRAEHKELKRARATGQRPASARRLISPDAPSSAGSGAAPRSTPPGTHSPSSFPAASTPSPDGPAPQAGAVASPSALTPVSATPASGLAVGATPLTVASEAAAPARPGGTVAAAAAAGGAAAAAAAADSSPEAQQQRVWLDAQVEELVKRREAVERLEREIAERDARLRDREVALAQKMALEHRRLQASKVFARGITELTARMSGVENELREAQTELLRASQVVSPAAQRAAVGEGSAATPRLGSPSESETLSALQQRVQQLSEQRRRLDHKRAELQRRADTGEFLSPEEEAALRAASDELDSLEAEIEYKNAAIAEAEAVLRGAKSSPAFLEGLPAGRPRVVVERCLARLTDAVANERRLRVALDQADARAAEHERTIAELHRSLQVAASEAARLQDELHKARDARQALAPLNAPPPPVAELQAELARRRDEVDRLERELNYYKKVAREYKLRLHRAQPAAPTPSPSAIPVPALPHPPADPSPDPLRLLKEKYTGLSPGRPASARRATGGGGGGVGGVGGVGGAADAMQLLPGVQGVAIGRRS